MEIILFYAYFVLAALVYIFIQLNYIFSWFKEITDNNAANSLVIGMLYALFWPVSLVIVVISILANFMENMHDIYKRK